MRVIKSVYEKPKPTKDSGLIYLFCEGENTEPSYFNYFKRKSTRLNLYIVPFPPDGNNSHIGLFNRCNEIIKQEQSDYDSHTDSIWLCIDTDDKTEEIEELKKLISSIDFTINLAQSNRSFEVWLYYHFHESAPSHEVSNWKQYLNEVIPGGFDCRSHPVYAERAIKNAVLNYSENEFNQPSPNSSNVFRLIELILSKINS